MDSGAYEEMEPENIRLLPPNYPKVCQEIYNNMAVKHESSAEQQPVSSQSSASDVPPHKIKHKHNILLGYDFVDENDSDIMAWDKAIQRKNKKPDRNRVTSPVLTEDDIK